jgi:hypothetical protein
MEWDNTAWLVCQVRPPTSYCADQITHSSAQFRQALHFMQTSLSKADCFCASQHETFLEFSHCFMLSQSVCISLQTNIQAFHTFPCIPFTSISKALATK